MWDVDTHHCKHCSTTFIIELDPDVSGDFLLECPNCKWQHYRHFSKGVAIHCDINKRHEDPKIIYSKRNI